VGGGSGAHDQHPQQHHQLQQQQAPETPSAQAMQVLTTPSPVLASGAAAASGALSGGASTSAGSSSGGSSGEEDNTEEEQQERGNETMAADATGTATQLPGAPQQPQQQQQPDDGVNRVSINLRALLPKKTKHGRIGGSLYRALRDAGVDISALKIPRGRPPRHKVGQKRPKRPTLLGLIKSGAALPMLPGARPLQLIVTDEALVDEDDEDALVSFSPSGTASSPFLSPPGSASSPATDAEAGFASPSPQNAGKGGLAAKAPLAGLREASNKQRGRRGKRGREEDEDNGEGGEDDVEGEMEEMEEDVVIEGMTADDAATGLLLLGKE
jgi:hypothetical protein